MNDQYSQYWNSHFRLDLERLANGEVERAVQTGHGLARALKEHIEQYSKIKTDPKSPLLALIIEHHYTQ